MTGTTLDHEMGKSIAAKVQTRVLPWLVAGWFIAYIDRFNVGFAALQMNADLGLTPATFGLGAGLFFLGYSVFEVPSNLVLVRVGARRWLSRIMVSWGIACMAMAAVQGVASFHVTRLVLGVAEAGCFPGMVFYLTHWLPRRQRTDALAKLGSMALISGVLGGPLAAALLALDGLLGLAGWQWLFLIEGAPAVILGFCLIRYLPDGPDTVTWLTSDERLWLRDKLAEEAVTEHTGSGFVAVIRNPRYWLWALVLMSLTAGGSSMRFWQPLLLRDIGGANDLAASLLPAISATVGAIAIIIGGRHSTSVDERRWHVAVPMVLSGIGLMMLGGADTMTAIVIAAATASLGNAAQPPLIATASAAAVGATNAAGIAFVNSAAGVGGFIGPTLWGYVLQSSGSVVVGTAMSSALVLLAAPLVFLASDAVSVRRVAKTAASS